MLKSSLCYESMAEKDSDEKKIYYRSGLELLFGRGNNRLSTANLIWSLVKLYCLLPIYFIQDRGLSNPATECLRLEIPRACNFFQNVLRYLFVRSVFSILGNNLFTITRMGGNYPLGKIDMAR